MKRPKTVQEYLQSVPKEVRGTLEQLRKTIKAAAPRAEERISYGMPYYHYNGRMTYFRLAKHHIGLYIPGNIYKQFKKELVKYETSNATLRLPLTQPLPLALIKKLIKARIKMTDAVTKKK